MQSTNLTLVSITNTNIKSLRGTWKLKVTFRLDDGPPQEIIVAQSQVDCFADLRYQIRKKLLIWATHETQLTGSGPNKRGKTWEDFVCDAMMVGYETTAPSGPGEDPHQ